MASGRFLAAALCVAAIICVAAAEPEASWGSKAADVADIIARSGPVHSLVAPARAASEAISFMQSDEVSELVPEELTEFISVDGAGAKKATGAAKKVKKVAAKKAAAKPVAKKAAAKKPTKEQSKAVKKTETSIKKVKAEVKKSESGIKKDSDEQKTVAKAARKAAIKAGPNGPKVSALKARAKAMAASLTHSVHKGPAKKPVKWSTKNVHLPKNFKGKLHMPKNFKVPTESQTKKKIWEATPPGIHTDEEYWKLKQLREEYHYKQGYEHMREDLLRKELRRHYASKLVRDHMRRKIDTLRRERALDEYGPGAHYKPFKWDEYDGGHSQSQKIAQQVSTHAHAKTKQDALHKEKKDIVDGKA